MMRALDRPIDPLLTPHIFFTFGCIFLCIAAFVALMVSIIRQIRRAAVTSRAPLRNKPVVVVKDNIAEDNVKDNAKNNVVKDDKKIK